MNEETLVTSVGHTAVPKRKILCFEWARGIAAAMVVLLHVTQGIMTNYPVDAVGMGRAIAWTLSQLVLTRWAVPVFLMISGALLLNPSKHTEWKDVWRYERRMILVLVTFGLLFCLMEQYSATHRIDFALFGVSLLNLLSGKSWSHLWYLYAMMGIYILLPVFKAFVRNVGERNLRILIVLMFLLTILVPSINDAAGTQLTTLIWLPSYIFYFLLGYYLFNYVDLTKRIAVCCSLIVAAGCVVQITYVMSGDWGEWVRSSESVFAAALSVLMFLLFKRYFERPYKPRGLVVGLSSYSFGIYVLHPLFLNVAYKALGLGPWSLPPVIFEASMWALGFFGSIAIIWVMRRIPGVRKIL